MQIEGVRSEEWRANMEERYVSTGRPVICQKCGGKYRYKSLGVYECNDCGNIELDDYGKVRTYLDEQGMAPAVVISTATGVPVHVIEEYLKDGKLEIPEGSEIYIKCENCGTEIRYGRYCPACASKLAKELKGTIHLGNIGEVPKERKGKMRFLNDVNK